MKQPWQIALQQAIRDPKVLCERLQLDSHAIAPTNFPLLVTDSFLARMEPGNPSDPLLRQILPTTVEQSVAPGFTTDPLAEADSNPVKGLLHKYANRVLITAIGQCAIHCRYCFRRHFPYDENLPNKNDWQAIIDYLHAHPEVNEVILSGGDPLVVSDAHFAFILEKIAAVHSIKTLRIHTRLPIVLPSRINETLCQILANTRLKVVVVLHSNHPQEINDEVTTALLPLQKFTLLNQAVLLRDINDDAATLAKLSEKLFAAGVLPYYLHLLDKVQGSQHFEVNEMRAKAVYAELQTLLPGYLLPKLVREIPGESNKQLIA